MEVIKAKDEIQVIREYLHHIKKRETNIFKPLIS